MRASGGNEPPTNYNKKMNAIHTAKIDLPENHTLTIDWFHDEYTGAPWEVCDGYGPVSDWTTRDKLPGEWTLTTDRRCKRFYNAKGAQAIALRDGWCLSPEDLATLTRTLGRKPTRREIAAQAVLENFENLKAWCDGDWHWTGYQARIVDGNGAEVWEDSLWGIDSPSMGYFEKEAAETALAWLASEIANRADAACRDIATI